ncbi:MAG: hypothetical protein U0636_07850 [Phycisphaerales bacterium]
MVGHGSAHALVAAARRFAGAAAALLYAVAAPCGCSTAQPAAPHVAAVETTQLTVVMRSDTPISSDERALADAVRASEKALQTWYGEPPATRVCLWTLTPEHQSSYLRDMRQGDNTGAATRVRRGSSDIYAATPDLTETAEGAALQLRLRQFQVAHEVVHAWLGQSAQGAMDEGFANFIAARAMEMLESEGPNQSASCPPLCGPHDAMVFAPRVVALANGRMPTVQQAASCTGQEAYVTGWLVFEFAASVLPKDEFRRFVQQVVISGSPSSAAVMLARSLRGGAPDARAAADADFAAFSATRARSQAHSLAPFSMQAMGYRPDGTAVMLGGGNLVLVHLSAGGAPKGKAKASMQALGGPAFPRCTALRIRRASGELPWSTLDQSGLLLGSSRPSSTRALVRSLDATLGPGGVVPSGQWLTLAVSGDDIVLRDSSGKELHRFAGRAEVPFMLLAEMKTASNGLAVLELQAEPVENDPAYGLAAGGAGVEAGAAAGADARGE